MTGTMIRSLTVRWDLGSNLDQAAEAEVRTFQKALATQGDFDKVSTQRWESVKKLRLMRGATRLHEAHSVPFAPACASAELRTKLGGSRTRRGGAVRFTRAGRCSLNGKTCVPCSRTGSSWSGAVQSVFASSLASSLDKCVLSQNKKGI